MSEQVQSARKECATGEHREVIHETQVKVVAELHALPKKNVKYDKIMISSLTYERLLRRRILSKDMKQEGPEYLIIDTLLRRSNANWVINYKLIYKRRSKDATIPIEVPQTLYNKLNHALHENGIQHHDELIWRLIENDIQNKKG